MNNFFEGLKNQIITYCISPIVLKFFCCLVMEKIKDKVLVASMKTLSTCKNPFSYPLQTACCGIQEPAYDSVNCP
jgi:hypothetical protein